MSDIFRKKQAEHISFPLLRLAYTKPFAMDAPFDEFTIYQKYAFAFDRMAICMLFRNGRLKVGRCDST